jgi:hypothetical protein
MSRARPAAAGSTPAEAGGGHEATITLRRGIFAVRTSRAAQLRLWGNDAFTTRPATITWLHHQAAPATGRYRQTAI